MIDETVEGTKTEGEDGERGRGEGDIPYIGC